jgi:Tol biopolymer transport system component
LTDFPVSEAVWSPQDSQIAYIAQRDGDITLSIIDVQTGETRSLTSEDEFVESNPTWTPDGASLIFARYQPQGDAEAEGPVSAGIWRVPADGSSPPQRLALTGDSIQVFAIR